MNMTMSREIFKACRILFGPEIDLTLEFLHYIQSSGIKSAYRRRALETHPDMAISRDGAAENAEDFHETHWAYERLIEFISTRDSFHARRLQPMRVPGSVVQPGRQRQRRRTRKPAGAARQAGYFYKSAMPRRKLMLGEYLFYGGHVPWEALIKAIVWQRRQRPKFGDMAMRWGWLSEELVLKGFRSRRLGEPIGQSLLRLGHLSEMQLAVLVNRQRGLQRPIGEYFVVNGYFTASRLSEHLEAFRRHNEKH